MKVRKMMFAVMSRNKNDWDDTRVFEVHSDAKKAHRVREMMNKEIESRYYWIDTVMVNYEG